MATLETHYPPEVNSQLEISLTAISLIGVDLYKGKITYGEANKRIAAARDDLMSKVTTIVQAYKKEIEAQQVKAAELHSQAESQRVQAANQERQAAAQEEGLRQHRNQMILNYLQANKVQIALPPQMPYRQPVTTNCTQNGSQTNCFSR
jgi:hypothetical protein